jgi:hypothetical protein
MARNQTPAPESKETPANLAAIAQDFQAANELAAIAMESSERARAVALQVGYQLPGDCIDPDLIQRDIAANMRRSVEACLEVGRGLATLKAACGHGNFTARLDVLGMDVYVASRFIQSAKKFSNLRSTANLTQAIGNQTKLFEMLVLDDEQIAELEQDGQTGALTIDDVATMSVKELRAALREAKAEKQASDQLLEKKNQQIDKLEREKQRIALLKPDEVLAEIKTEATRIAADALGAIRGGVRQALLKLQEVPEGSAQTAFAAGLIGELQAEINALREEFYLPDVSNASERELAAEVAQWANADTASA